MAGKAQSRTASFALNTLSQVSHWSHNEDLTLLALIGTLTLAPLSLCAQEPQHGHDVYEKLGTLSFVTSCAPAVQSQFERGVALLHSFEYEVAQAQFEEVAKKDPRCAMAYWGQAMTLYHELWSRPTKADLTQAAELLAKARSPNPRPRVNATISMRSPSSTLTPITSTTFSAPTLTPKPCKASTNAIPTTTKPLSSMRSRFSPQVPTATPILPMPKPPWPSSTSSTTSNQIIRASRTTSSTAVTILRWPVSRFPQPAISQHRAVFTARRPHAFAHLRSSGSLAGRHQLQSCRHSGRG
jgi:hypothetical protein